MQITLLLQINHNIKKPTIFSATAGLGARLGFGFILIYIPPLSLAAQIIMKMPTANS
jgi:hypothetical protein